MNPVSPKSKEMIQTFRKLLRLMGEDPKREGLRDTPKRMEKTWAHLLDGYSKDPHDVLKVQFNEPQYEGIVLCRDIEMFSMCEHHLLPFFGTATVGYFPKGGKIVGLSKLARVVDIFSRRLQNQERLTYQIGKALDDHLLPQGACVVISAEHLCMKARGIQKKESDLVTSYFSGVFERRADLRAEVMTIFTGKASPIRKDSWQFEVHEGTSDSHVTKVRERSSPDLSH